MNLLSGQRCGGRAHGLLMGMAPPPPHQPCPGALGHSGARPAGAGSGPARESKTDREEGAWGSVSPAFKLGRRNDFILQPRPSEASSQTSQASPEQTHTLWKSKYDARPSNGKLKREAAPLSGGRAAALAPFTFSVSANGGPRAGHGHGVSSSEASVCIAHRQFTRPGFTSCTMGL